MPSSRVFVAMGMIAAAVIAAFLLAWRPAIEPIEPPAANGFDAAQVRTGAKLAALGNCVSCHTAEGGQALAGGRGIATPFGTVYSTNITPDAQTGIGRWSEAAFTRALRQGVSRDGHRLYPAFPYDHFTRLRDEDIRALYAYAMTREPAQARARDNELNFPLQFRPLLAGWNLLFLQEGPAAPLPQGGEVARGAYLADALAHCAACHSPRNALGAERRGHAFAGGEAEGWRAPPLNAASESPGVWTSAALAEYLRTGIAADHAMSAGPMQEVIGSLSRSDPADVQAIAAYFTSIMGTTPERQAREQQMRQRAAAPLPADGSPGARLYADNCASCHDAGRGLSSNTALRLPMAVALHMPESANLLRIVRQGIQPPTPEAGRWMPGFEGVLTEEQLGTMANWLRRQAGQPAWNDLPSALAATRPPAP